LGVEAVHHGGVSAGPKRREQRGIDVAAEPEHACDRRLPHGFVGRVSNLLDVLGDIRGLREQLLLRAEISANQGDIHAGFGRYLPQADRAIAVAEKQLARRVQQVGPGRAGIAAPWRHIDHDARRSS
jgi:hypothetical protein